MSSERHARQSVTRLREEEQGNEVSCQFMDVFKINKNSQVLLKDGSVPSMENIAVPKE